MERVKHIGETTDSGTIPMQGGAIGITIGKRVAIHRRRIRGSLKSVLVKAENLDILKSVGVQNRTEMFTYEFRFRSRGKVH